MRRILVRVGEMFVLAAGRLHLTRGERAALDLAVAVKVPSHIGSPVRRPFTRSSIGFWKVPSPLPSSTLRPDLSVDFVSFSDQVELILSPLKSAAASPSIGTHKRHYPVR